MTNESKKRHNIELQSEEVQDILGRMPPWILRWDITIIALVLLTMIADPASRKLTYKEDDFLKCWLSGKNGSKNSGIALLLQPGPHFGDTEDDRLWHAVSVANIGDFINSLPMGYDTKIGMEGCGISQGQRQRILIARAVYKDPEYIFLDEATNSLDANNEKIIMENLHEFYKGKTVLIVAHRLSTVRHADNIIVLDHGKVVEQGTHVQLTAKHGAYYTLVKNQLELGK